MYVICMYVCMYVCMYALCTSQLNPRDGGGGGAGNGRAMPGLSCLVHQNAAPQGGDITN